MAEIGSNTVLRVLGFVALTVQPGPLLYNVQLSADSATCVALCTAVTAHCRELPCIAVHCGACCAVSAAHAAS